MMGVTHCQKLSRLTNADRATWQMTKPTLTPAKAQWARASLKKAMRLPTTREPTAPQLRLTSTRASRARTLKLKEKKLEAGAIWVKWSMIPSSQCVSIWARGTTVKSVESRPEDITGSHPNEEH